MQMISSLATGTISCTATAAAPCPGGMGDDALTKGEGQGTIRLDDPLLTGGTAACQNTRPISWHSGSLAGRRGGAGLLDSSSGTLAGLPFFAPSAIGRSLG